MTENPVTSNSKDEWLLQVIRRLCEIVAQLDALAGQLSMTTDTVPQLESNDLHPEAVAVRNERLRLIEAWQQLEAEQREQAMSSSELNSKTMNAPCNLNTKHAVGMPAITVTNQVPIDRISQFDFLRSEYERIRGQSS